VSLNKVLLAIALFAVPLVARAQVSLGLSLPQGFELSYGHKVSDSQWTLQAGVGGWPLERAWPGSLKSSSNLGETYAFDVAPRLAMLTSSFKAAFTDSSMPRWTFALGAEFWVLQTGAFVFLRNRDTADLVMVAELNARWWQPLFTAAVNWTFSQAESSSWSLELGLALPIGGALQSEIQGPLPALQKVAPEYADAIEDGSLAAQNNLSDTIQDALHVLPVIPSLGVRYVF
jgi:hypothetical protein